MVTRLFTINRLRETADLCKALRTDAFFASRRGTGSRWTVQDGTGGAEVGNASSTPLPALGSLHRREARRPVLPRSMHRGDVAPQHPTPPGCQSEPNGHRDWAATQHAASAVRVSIFRVSDDRPWSWAGDSRKRLHRGRSLGFRVPLDRTHFRTLLKLGFARLMRFQTKGRSSP